MSTDNDKANQPRQPPVDERTGLDRAIDAGPVWTGPATRPQVPYHEMTPEERREAWARLREAQGQRARQHVRAPWVFFGLGFLSWVVGLSLLHYRGGPVGSVLLWVGIGFAGFGAVALARNVMGGLAGRKDDMTPPGF